MKTRYWSSEKGDAEVDFGLQGATEVFPLEAKAARNLKAQSLKAYREFFPPPARRQPPGLAFQSAA